MNSVGRFCVVFVPSSHRSPPLPLFLSSFLTCAHILRAPARALSFSLTPSSPVPLFPIVLTHVHQLSMKYVLIDVDLLRHFFLNSWFMPLLQFRHGVILCSKLDSRSKWPSNQRMHDDNVGTIVK